MPGNLSQLLVRFFRVEYNFKLKEVTAFHRGVLVKHFCRLLNSFVETMATT